MRSTWRRGQPFDWVTDFDSWDRCITRGLPASMFPFMYNNGMRIFQSPGVVAIQMEMVHETRIIPTDGRAAIPAQIQQWLGESRGAGKCNTCVETTTSSRPFATTSSPPVRRAERHAGERAGPSDLAVHDDRAGLDRLQFTWSDPSCSPSCVLPPRVAARRRLRIYEYACHEAMCRSATSSPPRAPSLHRPADPSGRRPVIRRRVHRPNLRAQNADCKPGKGLNDHRSIAPNASPA